MKEAVKPVKSGDQAQRRCRKSIPLDAEAAETFHQQQGKPRDGGNQQEFLREFETPGPGKRNHRSCEKAAVGDEMGLLPFRKAAAVRCGFLCFFRDDHLRRISLSSRRVHDQ
jgi:hypothetical protein